MSGMQAYLLLLCSAVYIRPALGRCFYQHVYSREVRGASEIEPKSMGDPSSLHVCDGRGEVLPKDYSLVFGWGDFPFKDAVRPKPSR